MIVLVYFYDNMNELSPLIDNHKRKCGQVSMACYNKIIATSHCCHNVQDCNESTTFLTRSLVLSLSVCYHARLRVRSTYEVEVSKQFSSPLRLPGGAKQFRNEIQWYDTVNL